MMKSLGRAALLAGLAASLGAADLQDWSRFELKSTLGTYADEKGGKVELAPVAGPAKGEQAVKMTADLVQWGGLWAVASVPDLSQATALRFKAQASPGGQLMLSLTDKKKVQVEASVRVLEGDWQEFTVPLSLFKKSAWQMPDAPKDGVFDPSQVQSFNLSPRATGKSAFSVGPIAVLTGKVEARTGIQDGTGKDGALPVQDFETIETGYGTFQDDKSACTIGVKIVPEPGKASNKVASFDSKIAKGGWGGAWMRAGQAWGGQDWTGGKTLTLKVQSAQPLDLELAFNDANQNAYVAPAVHCEGSGWQTLTVPLAGFKLNEYYQPPEAKKGAPLDLSRIETFNLGVKTEGTRQFLVDDVVLHKK